LRRFAFDEAVDSDPFIARCRNVAAAAESGQLAKARRTGVPGAVLALEDRVLRRLLIAEALAKAEGYDPDEPRDDHGRWTSEGDGSGALIVPAASAVGEAAADLGRTAASIFGELGSEALAGLAALGARFSAPALFLGTLFIPTNSNLAQDGTLPGQPDVAYHFDLDTGTLSLARNGEVFYSGHHDQDGIFRDEDGNPFGREVDGSLVLDPDAVAGYASRSNAGAQPGAQVQSVPRADADSNEPKLCPDPVHDRGKDPEADSDAPPPYEFDNRAEAYQSYVTGLPPGWAVTLFNPVTGKDVYFDGCRETDGTMLEAKGPGYLDMLEKGPDYPWKGVEAKMLDQAQRQVAVAGGRPIVWYFAEGEVADRMRELFAVRDFYISVVVVPP
jgi:hypothetical protein